jgi:hypothetical protein
MPKGRGCNIGRYYSGDIDGKFWFAVQSSDAASRFGGQIYEPNYINYYFDAEEDLETVEEELQSIKDSLGENFELMEKFFNERDFYNNKDLAEYLKLDKQDVKPLLVNYADYTLGVKIRDCLKEQGYCEFEAEC